MIRGRLIGVRPLDIEDLPVMTVLANDPRVRASVVGWDWPVPAFSQETWLRASRDLRDTQRLAVVDLTSGKTIGLTGLWGIDWHNRSALSAVKLLPEAAGRGAGSDAVMLMNAWSFREIGLRRLYSMILSSNEASLKVYVEHCGWTVEGCEREAIFRNGEWHDAVRVAILRSEFEAHPDSGEYSAYVYPL